MCLPLISSNHLTTISALCSPSRAAKSLFSALSLPIPLTFLNHSSNVSSNLLFMIKLPAHFPVWLLFSLKCCLSLLCIRQPQWQQGLGSFITSVTGSMCDLNCIKKDQILICCKFNRLQWSESCWFKPLGLSSLWASITPSVIPH